MTHPPDRVPLCLVRDIVSLRLVGDSGVVGRDPASADLVVSSDQVSRRHAAWRRRGDSGIEVADLDSANGTFVDGARIGGSWVPVAVGQEVDFGRAGAFRLRIERLESRTAPSAPVAMVLRPGAEGDYTLAVRAGDQELGHLPGMRATLLFLLAEAWRREEGESEADRGWLPREALMRRLYGARSDAQNRFNKLVHDTRGWASERDLPDPIDTRARQIRLAPFPGGTSFEGC